MRDGRDTSCLQILAELCDEARRGRGRGTRIFSEVAAEARVDEQLFAMVGLVELDEKDSLSMGK